MSSAPQEIELKLHVGPGAMARLLRDPVLAQNRVGPRRKRHMVTTYFDTPDCRLAQCGIALRVRRIGERRIQTVKVRARAAAGESAAAAVRGEWEWRIARDEPDLGLLNGLAIEGLPDGATLASLAPIFSTDIERTTIEVIPEPDTRIELAFDRGAVRTAAAEAAISEVELELLPPASPDRVGLLYELALALHRAAPLRIGTESKADLGYALLGANEAMSRKAAPVDLAAEMSIGEAFARIAGACVAHMLDNQRCVLEEADAEGVRQMRIALRRLRAAMALFAPVLGAAAMTLKGEAKWLAGALSPARDWDAFADGALGRLGRDAAIASAVAAVQPQVAAARAEAHRQVALMLDGPRYTALVLELGRWIEAQRGRGGDTCLGEVAPALLDRRERKMRRAGKGISHATVEQRHALRKSLKAMRYAASFLAPLYCRQETAAYLRRLGRMQDRLGAANDLALADTLAAGLEVAASGPAVEAWPRLRRRMRARHAARLAKLPAAWKRVSKAERFWR